MVLKVAKNEEVVEIKRAQKIGMKFIKSAAIFSGELKLIRNMLEIMVHEPACPMNEIFNFAFYRKKVIESHDELMS